jgi:flagellar basal-body rod modification protein FlgD
MELNPTTSTTGSSGKGGSTNALSALNSDFDTFLKLLTTQLQNQDPTSPMNTNEMTQQLVQFANVEQQIAQNKNLEKLVNLQNANANSAAVSYIGHQVQVEGNSTHVTADGTTWGYEFDKAPETVTLNVLNAAGAPVYSAEGETTAGTRHTFDWNLANSTIGALPPGKYTMNVSAFDAAGDPVKATVDSTGLVNAVQATDDGPQLQIGDDITVTLAKIMKIL